MESKDPFPEDGFKSWLSRKGIDLQNPELLRLALTHASFAYERGEGESNQRLEFLGDAVLELVVREFVYRKQPEADEGELTRLKSNIVRGGSLALRAREMGLGKFILLGKGEATKGGRQNLSNLAGCLEAVIGAIYLDGGMEKVRLFVEREVIGEGLLNTESNYKGELQEFSQARGWGLPLYLVEERGEAEFEVKVKLKGEVWGEGKGSSKKGAEQMAARHALERLRNDYGL
jgi:ribonuclease-3